MVDKKAIARTNNKFKVFFLCRTSSLRLLSALRCLGGNIRSGFGELGRGMSSALVGSGYGWDGWVVC
jgi:hypothetical protein